MPWIVRTLRSVTKVHSVNGTAIFRFDFALFSQPDYAQKENSPWNVDAASVASAAASVTFDLVSKLDAQDVLSVKITGLADSTARVEITDKFPKIPRHRVEDVLQPLSETPVTLGKVC